MGRDPRIDPMPGDEIMQYSGHRLRVTHRQGDMVAWQLMKRGEWVSDNAWTLSGWQRVVCDRATVLRTVGFNQEL